MKRNILLITGIILLLPGFIGAQVREEEHPSLEKLFGRLKSATEDSVRLRINDSIRVIIDNYTKSDSVFNTTFREVRNLGQILSPDSQIKIITWNMVLDQNNGWYFCYLIKRGLKGKENTVFHLQRKYDPEPVSSDTTYTQSDWYGALYYDIRPFRINGKTCYILLGINYGDPIVTRKLIDVLSFTPDNAILFGRKWFKIAEKTHFRHVLEYASDGVVSLRFSSSKSIVFDHLVPVPSITNEGRILYGSDYSFDAYVYKDGFWNLIRNIDARNKK